MVVPPDTPGATSEPHSAQADTRSDARYQRLFALSPQPAWVYDSETLRFLEVNEAAVRSYGWTREEFLRMTLRDIRPEGEQPKLDRLLAETPGRELHATASIHRTRSGQRRRVEISSYPLEFDGHPARMVLVHDITERQEAQDALLRSEQKYRTVIEQLQDVFFRTDEQGFWTFLNPAWITLTGNPVEESIGTACLAYVHPSDRATLLDAFRPLVEGRAEHSVVEVRYFRRDGGYRWVEASTRALHDELGRFYGTTGTLRDVTERRAAEEERLRLATNIRQLLDASGEGVYGLDARGVVTFMNRRGSELLGYEPGELVGRRMHETTHHSRPDGTPYPADECPVHRAATQGIPCQVDDEVLWRKDGTPLEVEYAASPVREQGRLSGAVVNFRDITARKRAALELVVARDAAQAANRAKSDFLARMSHELRTPLNSIIGFANVLLKNKNGSFQGTDVSYLSRIATNGRHLLALINDILDLSKIEAGHMTLHIAPVALDTLVRETVEEIEGQARERGVALRAELPARALPLETDAARMKQVLINLLGNAIKFTEDGEVVVRLYTDDVGVPTRLEVRDTGIGIASDRLDAIFNVFEQAESMITRRYGGTGLGLAISRSLCDLMGHRLEVASAEGKGTTMLVRLRDGASRSRMRTPGAMPAGIHGPNAPPTGPQHIALVVDDDADARVLLGALLDEAGVRAVSAATGVEALRLARELRPAIIFLDLLLPRISGYDVLRILQTDEALRGTPVVVVSAVGTESRSALAGAAAILDKPIDRAALMEVLQTHLASVSR
ncbi:MAG: PAS domain S-box protein [Gemmatimonadaceae bacterium]|nr:PAS domain S-box protein [Gemmatimonadaceae bacterium]